MAGHHDFDAAWAEHGDGPTITVLGDTVTLPPVLPAKCALFIERARMDAEFRNRDVSLSMLVEQIGAVVGADIVAGWVDRGLTVDQLGDIWSHILRVIWSDVANPPRDGDASGGAKPPTAGAPSAP